MSYNIINEGSAPQPDNLHLAIGASEMRGYVGCTVAIDTTQVGCVTGSAETALYSGTILANALDVNGQSLEFYCVGTFANSASIDKNVTVQYGAVNILQTGNMVVTGGGNWSVHGTVIRTGDASQKCVVVFNSDDSSLRSLVKYTATTATMSANVTAIVWGKGTFANDVVGEFTKVSWSSTDA